LEADITFYSPSTHCRITDDLGLNCLPMGSKQPAPSLPSRLGLSTENTLLRLQDPTLCILEP
jgi:hypothetical protein